MQRVEHRDLRYLYHLILCGIGFVGLVVAAQNKLLATWVMKQYELIPFSPWAVSTLKAHPVPKITQITSYMVGVTAMTFYLFGCVVMYNKARHRLSSEKAQLTWPWLIVIGLVNLGLFNKVLQPQHDLVMCGEFIAWLGLLCYPEKIIKFAVTPVMYILNYMTRTSVPFIVLLFLASGVFLAALSPYFKLDNLQVGNDYLWVPEQTFLSSGKVDNNAFISSHRIGGMYDGRIVGNNALSQPADQSDIDEFITKNKYEITQQILAGHYFHHQHAMLGPISELFLGKDPGRIAYLYGKGNVQLLAFLVKQRWHDLTLENYTFVLYAFYIVYFCLYAACCYMLFRDFRYTSLTVATAIGLVLLMGFELIRLAPGYNPLRHMLDMPLLMLFVVYLYAHRHQSLKLALVLTVGLLAIYANRESGLMMFLSLAGAAGLHIISTRQSYREFILLVVGSIGASILWLSMQSGPPNSMMSLYYLLGVSVAPSDMSVTVCLLLCTAVGNIGLLMLYVRRGSHYRPLFIGAFLLFYIECLLVYFAWYTESNHLLSLAPIYALFVVYLTRELLALFLSPIICERLMIFAGSAVAVLVLQAGSFNYFHQMHKYNKIFKTHAIYEWNFPRFHAQSTMDPAVFQEAVGLIKKYSQDNAIYLISKYDNLLPFLSGRYSALSYSPIMMTLVTDREVNQAANEILQASPKYLFVDSDIGSDNKGDIITASPLKEAIIDAQLSSGRVMVLRENKRVFHKIASQYKLIQSGYLVSVYEHI